MGDSSQKKSELVTSKIMTPIRDEESALVTSYVQYTDTKNQETHENFFQVDESSRSLLDRS